LKSPKLLSTLFRRVSRNQLTLESPSPSLEVPSLDNLDGWLADREHQIHGLKPGVEAGIVWADSKKLQTSLSIVYLPGYTATRAEIYPSVERISRTWGANVFFTRPTGQGVGAEGHRHVTVEDWIRDGHEALEIGRRLGKRLILMATSTGGTLATWLLLGPTAAQVAASILISPNLTPMNRGSEMLLWPGKELWLSLFVGKEITLEPRNELQAKFWDLNHHSHSLIPMMQLVKLARTLDFRRWSSPVLVVYDPEDTVVNEAVTVKLFSRVPASLVTLHPWNAGQQDDHHVLAGDALSPGGTDAFVDLVNAYLKTILEKS
jgi:esterase/lipase